MIPCGPKSKAFLAHVAVVSGTRRIAAVCEAASAWRHGRVSEMVPWPCSMSMTTKSYPERPAISARVGEKVRRKRP